MSFVDCNSVRTRCSAFCKLPYSACSAGVNANVKRKNKTIDLRLCVICHQLTMQFESTFLVDSQHRFFAFPAALSRRRLTGRRRSYGRRRCYNARRRRYRRRRRRRNIRTMMLLLRRQCSLVGRKCVARQYAFLEQISERWIQIVREDDVFDAFRNEQTLRRRRLLCYRHQKEKLHTARNKDVRDC